MSTEADTKPTLETVLERITTLGNKLHSDMQDFRSSVEDRLERIEIRLDRVESMALETRADVRELRKELRAHLNQFDKPS
jgi:predicted component of type VI protein secretion system